MKPSLPFRFAGRRAVWSCTGCGYSDALPVIMAGRHANVEATVKRARRSGWTQRGATTLCHACGLLPSQETKGEALKPTTVVRKE